MVLTLLAHVGNLSATQVRFHPQLVPDKRRGISQNGKSPAMREDMRIFVPEKNVARSRHFCPRECQGPFLTNVPKKPTRHFPVLLNTGDLRDRLLRSLGRYLARGRVVEFLSHSMEYHVGCQQDKEKVVEDIVYRASRLLNT